MKYIAHRGLLDGPDLNLENTPEQIEKALSLGFECEIDVWVVDDELYLGHDFPKIKIKREFIENSKFWIHAKNLDALYWLSINAPSYNYFWHEADQFTLTSKQFIWTCQRTNATPRTVVVLLEQPKFDIYEAYGICSDYGNLFKTNSLTK